MRQKSKKDIGGKESIFHSSSFVGISHTHIF